MYTITQFIFLRTKHPTVNIYTKEILTDMTIYSCPSWNAVTVISTNEIFARVSINTGFPLTLISICERRENKE